MKTRSPEHRRPRLGVALAAVALLFGLTGCVPGTPPASTTTTTAPPNGLAGQPCTPGQGGDTLVYGGSSAGGTVVVTDVGAGATKATCEPTTTTTTTTIVTGHVVDQQNSSDSYTYAPLDNPPNWTELGQTFTAAMTGTLDQVSVIASQVSGTAVLTINVYAVDPGGLPTGPILGSGTLQPPGTGGTTFADIPLTNAVLVSAGSSYAITLSGPGWGTAFTPDAYSHGTALVLSSGGSTWATAPSQDLAFKTWVQ